MGVKALHPNDGWIKRKDNIPYEADLPYPSFIDRDIGIGDKVALVDFSDKHKYTWRITIVEITGIMRRSIGTHFYIKPTNEYYYFNEDVESKLIKT